MPEEVHAVLQALSDLYVHEGKGYGDLNITLVRESDQGGATETVTGFQVLLEAEAVTLGVGAPNIQHETIPLHKVVRVVIER